MLPGALVRRADHALRAADVGIVASGTATLRRRGGLPHIVFYRVNLSLRYRQAKLLLPFVGLPNILAGRSWWLNSCRIMLRSPIARATLNLYDDTVTRHRLETLFAGMASALHRHRGGSRCRRAVHGGAAC
jgi:lipid A disaccharide synthetase